MDNTDRMPFLDKGVEYVWVSKLRLLNNANLRDLKKPLVVMSSVGERSSAPLAVILSYDAYTRFQSCLVDALEKLELLTS